jgi:transcriptional regulator with XRE-family HTH domain
VTTQETDWTRALHQRIADAIKQARQGQRLTAQQLADETERLDYPISRSQIAAYEVRRKRGLDVTELLILAAALNVPPVALLFPDLPDGGAEPLPGWHATAADALGWFTGEIVDEDEDAEYTSETRLVALTRRRFGAQRRLRSIYEGLVLIGKEDRADELTKLAGAAEEVGDINRQIAAIPTAVVAKNEGKQQQ